MYKESRGYELINTIFNYFLDQNSQKHVALCVVFMALGACMAVTINYYITINNNSYYYTEDPIKDFNNVELAGEIFSLLSLVS